MRQLETVFPLLIYRREGKFCSILCVWKCEGLGVHFGVGVGGRERHSCEELKWQCDEYYTKYSAILLGGLHLNKQ